MNTFAPDNHSLSVRILTLTAFIIVLAQIPTVLGKLTIEKECGENTCEPHYYCSSADHFCRPCQIVFDPVLGNYDKAVCERDCQGLCALHEKNNSFDII